MDNFVKIFKAILAIPDIVSLLDKVFPNELHVLARHLVKTGQHQYSVLNIHEIIASSLKKGKRIEDIKQGFFCISKYPLCIYLGKDRPEFHQIRAFSGYHTHEIKEKLDNFEQILEALGYRYDNSTQLYKLSEEERQSPGFDEKTAKICCDLVLAIEELDLFVELSKEHPNDPIVHFSSRGPNWQQSYQPTELKYATTNLNFNPPFAPNPGQQFSPDPRTLPIPRFLAPTVQYTGHYAPKSTPQFQATQLNEIPANINPGFIKFLATFKAVRESPNLIPSRDKGFPTELHQIAKDLVVSNKQEFSILNIYELIIYNLEKGKSTEDIRQGLFSISKYPLCLYLDKDRPEFHQIRTFSAYYTYEIKEKLDNFEQILEALGYRYDNSAQLYKLSEEKRQNPGFEEKIARIGYDLVLALEELDLYVELSKGTPNDPIIHFSARMPLQLQPPTDPNYSPQFDPNQLQYASNPGQQFILGPQTLPNPTKAKSNEQRFPNSITK